MESKRDRAFWALGVSSCVILAICILAFLICSAVECYIYVCNYNKNTTKIEQLQQENKELQDSLDIYREWFMQAVD